MNDMTKPHKPYPRKRVLFDIYLQRPIIFGVSISHLGFELSIFNLRIGIFALRVDFDKMNSK